MLMSENWLKQDVRILHFMHRICGTFCVRRYQQFYTLMVNGNAYNQNSLIAVTQWVEKTDLLQKPLKYFRFSKGHNSKSKLYHQKYMKEKKGSYQFLLKWLTAYE